MKMKKLLALAFAAILAIAPAAAFAKTAPGPELARSADELFPGSLVKNNHLPETGAAAAAEGIRRADVFFMRDDNDP